MRLGDEAPMSTSIIGGSSSQTQNLTQSLACILELLLKLIQEL